MAHQGIDSGLQVHSIGEDYPYTVVATIDTDDCNTVYYVTNLETGKDSRERFCTSKQAHAYAKELKARGGLQ
jgi:hypothetical protein